MTTRILKVMAQTEPLYVPSRKQENGQLAKCQIRLKELGGEYEDEYMCTMFGELALTRFEVGRLVAVGLRFQAHEAQGGWYQDITVSEIKQI